MRINWRPWIVGLAVLAIFVRFPDIAISQVWDSSTEYNEDDAYDSSFLGPLGYCVRADSAAAKADSDGGLQPLICDNAGKLWTTSSGGGGGLTDAELRATAVPVSATSLPLPSGAATSAKQLADGHNVTVDNASIPVTATNLDVQIGGSDVVVVDLAGNNDVVVTAGLLHANSPTTKVAVLTMIDGSADSDIVTTNLSKSSAITITGSGKIVKICLVVEGTSPFAEDGTIYFFSADPAISSNTADMTVAEAITVEVMVSLSGSDYNANFATVKLNCQFVDESFASITHVAYEQEGSTTIANQDFRLLVLYERRS